MCEGAPIGFIWWALPAMLRLKGIPVENITTLTALLVLPWAFKFLWAPLIDIYSHGKSGARGWIISMQVLMGLSLLPLVFIDPVQHYTLLGAVLFIHAIFSSTQDISIDTLCIRNVHKREFGKINGYMQAGMLTGRSLFGGGVIYASGVIGWNLAIFIMIGFIVIPVVVLIFLKGEQVIPHKEKKYSTYLANLRSAFGVKSTWIGLLFALTGAAAFESAGALASPFLVDTGADEKLIGLFFLLPVVLAMLIGGLAVGRFYDKKGRIKSVALSMAGFILAISSLGVIDLTGGSSSLVYPAIILLTVMYFFIGAFTASSYALFMHLTNKSLGATQFSTFMAATNGCESWSGWAGGRIAGASGYGVSFIVMSGVSLLSMLTLKLLKPKEKL
jgi:MFS transporter (putative signal transducer)